MAGSFWVVAASMAAKSSSEKSSSVQVKVSRGVKVGKVEPVSFKVPTERSPLGTESIDTSISSVAPLPVMPA